MEHSKNKEELAQHLLEPGQALRLAKKHRIKSVIRLSEDMSVDMVSLVARALSAIELNKPKSAERALTDLLVVLLAEPMQIEKEVALELRLRREFPQVLREARKICEDSISSCSESGASSDDSTILNLQKASKCESWFQRSLKRKLDLEGGEQ